MKHPKLWDGMSSILVLFCLGLYGSSCYYGVWALVELGLLIVVGLDLWNYMRDPENQLPLHPVSEKAGKEAA